MFEHILFVIFITILHVFIIIPMLYSMLREIWYYSKPESYHRERIEKEYAKKLKEIEELKEQRRKELDENLKITKVNWPKGYIK